MCQLPSQSNDEMDTNTHQHDEMDINTHQHDTTSSQLISIHQNKNEEILEDESTDCGLGGCSPRWLQLFASKKAYVLVYGVLGMNQAAINSYFIGTISTIEKMFKLPSSTFGLIASSWDIGVILTVLAMGYLGTSGHKTKLVALSAVFAAASCFLRYVPHILFGDNNILSKKSNIQLCDESNIENENCSFNSEGLVTTFIFICAHIILGVGTSTYSTLGAAYLDDNSVKDKAPFLLSLTSCFRHLGPTVGFLLASYALKMNDSNSTLKQNDQRFIGAWYWGWVPLGIVHLVLALMMAFFPKILPREANRRKSRNYTFNNNSNIGRKKWSMKDVFGKSSFFACSACSLVNGGVFSINSSLSKLYLKYRLKRLVKNRLLMYSAFSSTLYMFGVIGFRIFLPKYIEAQFFQTASRANFITGTVGIGCSLLGVFAGGCIISRFKPHPRTLAAWSFVTKVIEFIMYIMFAFISCEKGNFFGVNQNRFNVDSNCNAMCECLEERYSPVCDWSTGTTFFSPCQAGCRNYSNIDHSMLFSDCSCLENGGFLKDGACSTNCEHHFVIFLVLLCLLKFLSSTCKSGTTIIQYRCVDPEDKSLSIALSEVMQSCLAFIPAPIIYGAILDSSCLLWEEECGRKGNCLLYHEQTLRIFLNFISAGFVLMAAFFDVGVFSRVKMLNIYDDDAENTDASEKLNVNNETKNPEIQ